MNAAEFAAKWIGNTNTERGAAQEHFIDICTMLGVPTPNTDRGGEAYAFEKGATKTSGGGGWADVWLRGHFGWEYKGHHKDLEKAYKQLLDYREALENPPLLVVSDLNRVIVRTNFTNTVRGEHSFTLEDLRNQPAEPLRILRALFDNPEALKPTKTRGELTEEAAGAFAGLAQQLREAGHEPQRVAHFLNKLLFALFAENATLLPAGIIRQLGQNWSRLPSIFASRLSELFGLMSTEPGGAFGPLPIQWFNGGLFDGPEVLPLTTKQIEVIARVSILDWSQVEPAVFGTLFERGLDPSKRSQLGAHYTDRTSIERIVHPVVIELLEREWATLRDEVDKLIAGFDLRRPAASSAERAARTRAIARAQELVGRFLARLNAVRVLDPACGSGNFLYVALQALKDLERRVIVWEADALVSTMRFPTLGPQNVQGIELNSYAAEMARVTIWIGEIQWMIANGFAYLRDPILRPLDNIECRDAVISDSEAGSTESSWPEAEFIVGNPPFCGGNQIRSDLGDSYVDNLFRIYNGRVPAQADLVCYWYEKARAAVAADKSKRVGLLATQSIRGGVNRTVLDRIKESGDIFMAWADEPWVVEGAAVHVSIVGYDNGTEVNRQLNGLPVHAVNANLTSGLDLTGARPLRENRGIAFSGDEKAGSFEISAELARAMLAAPNPDGRSNSDVVRPWINGEDLTQGTRGLWIIDFGVTMSEEEAALYEAPFEYVRLHVRPTRIANRRALRAKRWWIHGEPRPAMRRAVAGLERFLVTVIHSKHRLFVWLDPKTLPTNAMVVFARDDDYFFGVLQSFVHESWARHQGTQLREVESGFRYTANTTFETFPFPQPTETQRNAIASAAKALDTFREGWLNPVGMPPHELKNRTLTNLYNRRPAWLAQAHERLDRVVFDAYGWPYPLDDQELLGRLLQLNEERVAQSGGATLPTVVTDDSEEEL